MDEAQIETLEYILERIEDGTAGVLSDWERSFMQDQKSRYKSYGADTRFSPRQWAVIEKIETVLVEGKASRR